MDKQNEEKRRIGLQEGNEILTNKKVDKKDIGVEGKAGEERASKKGGIKRVRRNRTKKRVLSRRNT